MSRQADPRKKPELLEKTLDFLLDKPLAALTFRSLAAELGTSTFTLVYHFGSRAELVREIIRALGNRPRGFEQDADIEPFDLDVYVNALWKVFRQALTPRNMSLQRLEFEAQMLEALEPVRASTFEFHAKLQGQARDALVALGVPEAEATIESVLFIDTFFGIQGTLIMSGDTERATATFTRAIERHRDHIRELTAVGAH